MTRSLRYLRQFSAAAMLFCVMTVVALSPSPAVIVVCAVAGVLYVRAFYAWPGSWALRLLPLGLAGAVIAAAQSGAEIWPAVAVPALLAVAVMATTSWPRLPIGGISLAITGVTVVVTTRDWPTALLAAGATLMCVVALLSQLWVWEIAVRVDRERSRDAIDAVDRERQRFAADLHDIQGHSLEAIVLKSELAARLVDTDPARAAAEMHSVQQLAREALRDTRSVAHGYREVSLATEMANAVGLLRAAGVRCETALASYGDVPPDSGRLLALLVREATTNMLRHSEATIAEITLMKSDGGVQLTVHNDRPLDMAKQDGQGLAGLAERFAEMGGTLRWTASAARFEIDAALPWERPATRLGVAS